jgi:drug/metabolite transporter (DMT)-like permease
MARALGRRGPAASIDRDATHPGKTSRRVTAAGRPGEAPAWRVWLALWVVYIVWGSTYLAIRVMVRTVPPLLGGGVRFLLAGTLMCGWIGLRSGFGSFRVTRSQLASTALVGALLPAGGNGLVTLAEKHLPSGLAALIVASVPLWVVLLRYLDRQRMHRGTLGGVALGFAGVALLLLPGGQPEGVHAVGFILVLCAAASWASGSFISPRLTLPRDPFVTTGIEMLFGGAILTVAGVAAGEAPDFRLGHFSGESIAGLAYLITIGSILAYSAYVWLLQHAPISKVSTYAYVNPVIAVFLGWAILGEQVTVATLLGAAVIVASVAAIVRQESAPSPASEPGDAAVAERAGAG